MDRTGANPVERDPAAREQARPDRRARSRSRSAPRSNFQGVHRPDQPRGRLLRRREGRDRPPRADPGRAGRGGRARPPGHARGPLAGLRRDHGAPARGAGGPARPDPQDDPRGDDRPADLPGAGRLGLQEQGRPAPARRRQRATCPARSTARSSPRTTTTAWPRSPSRPTPTPRWSPWRSSSSRSRSARSPTCGSTRGRSRRAASTSTPPAEEGADQPHPPRPRRREGRHRLGRGRRHRRRHGHRVRHRRHVLRRGDELLAREHLRRRAGHRPVDLARPSGPTRTSSRKALEPLHARGPDLPRPRRPGDQRDDHLGHGRAAPGDLRRADPPRVQGRVHRRHARRSATARRRPRSTPFNYKHKKQTGGSGQYAHVVGVLEPLPEDSPEPFVFENKVTGGRIPSEYIPSVEKGFRDSPRTRARSPATR